MSKKKDRKQYAMYVWTKGFDHTVSGCDMSKFLQWDKDGPCFTHVWELETKRGWLWATCNRAGREIDTIFLSGVHDSLKTVYDSGDCDTAEIATVKDMLREGHTLCFFLDFPVIPNLKIYVLYATSDINVSEREMVKHIVHYNDVCAENSNERFDGVAVNNEAYGDIKCSEIRKRLLYLDNLQQIVTEARKQRNGTLLTHFSVGWHWGKCDGRESLMTWKGKTCDVVHHVIYIFDSIDVQVGCISFPDISERMHLAGYKYALTSHKPIFATLYTNPTDQCQTSFFPHDAVPGHSEKTMFSIIDDFPANYIPHARACIHYFRGVYSAGVHPDWPVVNS